MVVNVISTDKVSWAQFLRKTLPASLSAMSRLLTQFSDRQCRFKLAFLSSIMIETAFCSCSLSNLSEQAVENVLGSLSLLRARWFAREMVLNVTNSSKEFS